MKNFGIFHSNMSFEEVQKHFEVKIMAGYIKRYGISGV